MEAECGLDAEDADGQGGAGRKRGGRAAAVAEHGRGEGGKRAPRRAGGKAVGDTLGRKRNAQAASVPPPRE
eukprot:2437929-Prymnesium_polylepis.1